MSVRITEKSQVLMSPNELVNVSGSLNQDHSRGLFWMMVPLALLVISVSGWLYMVSLAVDDPGFAVERDYYKKASNYDEQMAQSRENARLGWTAELLAFSWLPSGDAQLTISVQDKGSQTIEGLRLTGDAFPIARSTRVQNLQFEAVSSGAFRAIVSRPRAGLWEVRVAMQKPDGATATAVLRPELSALAGVKRGGPSGD